MRIKIGTKLTAGFALVLLGLVALSLYSVNVSQKFLEESVGKSSVFLAEEMLKRMNQGIYLRMNELQTHIRHLVLQKSLSESNREFRKLAVIEAYINQKDREWVSAPKDKITPFMQELISTDLSNHLREDLIEFYQKKYGYVVIAKLFVTNKYGANVAQSGKTCGYRQDDEEWWQIAREKGYYVSAVVYDESTEENVISLGVRIDDKGGDFIGIMKAVVAVKSIIRSAEIAVKKYETTRIKLITNAGRLIYKTGAYRFLEDVSDKNYFKQIKGEKGFFIAEAGGRERLNSYARSKKYRNFEGMGWVLVVGHDVQEILKPAFQLRNRMVTAAFILIALGIIVAFFISRSITKPITILSKGVRIIGKGDLKHRVEVESKDEIGEFSDAFNKMVEKLQQAEDGMLKARDKLEMRVKERTVELAEANEDLKQRMDESKQAKERIDHLNAVLRAIRNINLLIITEKDPDRLIKGVCDNLISTRGYYNAWIALFDESGNFVAAGQKGLDEKFSRLLEVFKRGDLVTCGRKAFEQSGVLAILNPLDDCGDCPLSNNYANREAMTARLEHDDKIYGLVSVSIPKGMATDREEQVLFEEVANDIAFALNVIESEVKKSEFQEALRKSEEFNKTIIENSTDCIKILDLDGRLEFMSPGGQELLEIEDIGTYLNQSWIDFWKGSDRTAALETISRAKKGGAGRFRGYCPTEKGTEKWWDIIITPFVGQNGKVQQLLAVSRDITKHRKADEALRESEEKYRLVLENAYDAIFIAQDELIKFPNPKTQEMSGYSAEELTKLPFISLVHPEDKDMVLDRYMRWMKGEEPPATVAFRIINKAGEELWVELNTTAVSWDKRPATLNILRDVTSQKKLEAQFLQAQKMEAIGTLAGGVAHDFNNLLTAILGYAELSLMGLGKDNPVREEIEEIKKAGNSAASLIRQLLAFSRKQILQPMVSSLNTVITNLEKMLSHMIRENVRLKTLLEPDLGAVKVDSGQIEQVIMNLVINAADAMSGSGNLTIETANVDLDENYFRDHGVKNLPGPYVMLAVSDTGTGMDEKTQSRIFEPFFTTKEKDQGTGLGLSTVYGIIKQSNGYIWVYSEPGEGTTFKIYFPRIWGEAEPVDYRQVPTDRPKGSETVLIVEDDDTLRKLAHKILDSQGYTVLEAENGEEALQVSEAHEGPIHLLLTDVVMPKMSGRETAERLQPLRSKMKVLYMSGYTDNTIADHGVLAPELNYLEKPFTPESLARKVREVLDK